MATFAYKKSRSLGPPLGWKIAPPPRGKLRPSPSPEKIPILTYDCVAKKRNLISADVLIFTSRWRLLFVLMTGLSMGPHYYTMHLFWPCEDREVNLSDLAKLSKAVRLSTNELKSSVPDGLQIIKLSLFGRPRLTVINLTSSFLRRDWYLFSRIFCKKDIEEMLELVY